ncbi:nitric oxide synthase, inducible isoform X2 [Bombina bombina]|uniref:nitric oxide synthase, inducible isoform X2 n=1 Tax=Bombina bombina TaxID=8345 RepID=UPI00235A8F43|nr:nitric oxide synthase, inducible isoform X2 [Bombina bombina]
MMCPWKLFTKSGNFKVKPFDDTMDINNNLTKDPENLHSVFKHIEGFKINGEKENVINTNATSVGTSEKVKNSCKVSSCPRYMQLKNYENGMTLQDTLHLKSEKSVSCKSKNCQGSIMNPKNLIKGPRDQPISMDELLPQAIEFINQYYNSFKEPQIDNHLKRVEAVTKEIELTGTYQLTLEELIFASKQAWRNAPRCIGRIQWSNLQVFDGRNCKTAKEMFDFICRHIKYSSNGGNIRSAITIFPQRTDGKHDFRVWNSQLVRYAGFEMQDGSIRGDPASVEFTELCIQLGWKPKYGRFEILPIVLQANGQDPEVFEIPSELIPEVPLEHPTYEWFKEMNLRWYTLPAVANMLLEAGGIEFTACPFNGWYMGTEIGVRDFCDVQRYNVLEEVGKRLGLETHKLASLWKDKAVIEINVAVLYSFQKHNVTIMDHHSAAESFMKHMQNEYKLRGGCPADWVWIVPPISGSITPVFHQEMLNYILSPFYYYQVDAWKTHVWKDESRKPMKKKFKFSVISKAVLFASALMAKSVAARTKATILYATETGKSETLAKKLHTVFNYAFNTKICCMADYDISQLDKETLLLVVTSTFGNGDCPGNGEKFKKSLFALKQLKKKLRYAVFGLGSSMYPQFCAFAHNVDQKLAQLGGSQISLTGEGDELNGQEESFLTWAVHTFKAACEVFKIRDRQKIMLPKHYSSSETWHPENYRLVNETLPFDLIKALSKMHSKYILPMKLKFRQNLQSQKSSRATLLLQLSAEDRQEVQYLPGEHVGLFPANQSELVMGIIGHLKDAPPSDQDFRLETRSEQGNFWAINEKIPACSLFQALTYFLDITSPPTQLLLKKLSLLATDDRDKTRLETLCKSADEYNEWKFYKYPTFFEVLEEFPSLQVPTTFLLTQLPTLKPRYYSISSSVDMVPGEIHLTVAVVNYNTKEGKGPLHHGVCSTWLNSMKLNDTVPCFIRSTNTFHLPENPAAPCLLIGPGTGISPYRGFWQQRLYDQQKKGTKASSMILLSGCQQSELDDIYKEETADMKSKGVLKEVYMAYSREPGKAKIYVQDLLKSKLENEVCRILLEEEGHLYVCGGIQMARDVASALKYIIAKKMRLNEEETENYFSQLKNQMRYHEDIFGAAHKPLNAKNGIKKAIL